MLSDSIFKNQRKLGVHVLCDQIEAHRVYKFINLKKERKKKKEKEEKIKKEKKKLTLWILEILGCVY